MLGGPDHDRLGFRFWKHPGPFVQFHGIAGSKGRFLGFWAVLTQAAFSYIGTEIVAVCWINEQTLKLFAHYFVFIDCCWRGQEP